MGKSTNDGLTRLESDLRETWLRYWPAARNSVDARLGRREGESPKSTRQRAKVALSALSGGISMSPYMELRRGLEREYARWRARREGYSARARMLARNHVNGNRDLNVDAARRERRGHRQVRRRRRGYA